MKKDKPFNFVIGTLEKDGRIATYTIHSQEVIFGDQTEAEAFLEYVKAKSPKSNWRIFKIEVK